MPIHRSATTSVTALVVSICIIEETVVFLVGNGPHLCRFLKRGGATPPSGSPESAVQNSQVVGTKSSSSAVLERGECILEGLKTAPSSLFTLGGQMLIVKINMVFLSLSKIYMTIFILHLAFDLLV